MNKQVLKTLGLSCCLLLALAGCREIEGVDYLNAGHPADPASATGKTARMSRALVPENINVSPEFGTIGAPRAAAQPPAAGMDHSKMDHSKMNHGGK